METADVQHLAELARIALTDREASELASEFGVILGYVAQLTEVSSGVVGAPDAGIHTNVFREDVETNEPGAYTEVLLDAVPERSGEYIHVKKILGETP